MLQELNSLVLLAEEEVDYSVILISVLNVVQSSRLREGSILERGRVLSHLDHQVLLLLRCLNDLLRPDDCQVLNEFVHTSVNAFTEFKLSSWIVPVINVNSNVIGTLVVEASEDHVVPKDLRRVIHAESVHVVRTLRVLEERATFEFHD